MCEICRNMAKEILSRRWEVSMNCPYDDLEDDEEGCGGDCPFYVNCYECARG